MKRKIIHITAIPDGQHMCMLFALCDDGTVWQMSEPHKGNPSWQAIPDVPLRK